MKSDQTTRDVCPGNACTDASDTQTTTLNSQRDILVIGYGNPGRLDDGLGPAAADALEAMNLPGVTVDSDYQLVVEDAEAASRHEVVVFIDADANGPEPFSLTKVHPLAEVSFTTHSVSAEAVVGLAGELFGARPEGYMLGIRGYEFNEFEQRLSEPARANLDAAVAFLARQLQSGILTEVRPRVGPEHEPNDNACDGDVKCQTKRK